MTKNEAMKLALDNLIAEYHMENSSFAKRVDDIFKEVPAQPQPAQQEPVAILNHAHGIHTVRSVKLNGLPDGEYNLYTSPQPPAPAPGFCKNCKDYTVEAPLAEQPAQRKPLTDEEIADIATSHPLTWVNLNTVEHRRYFARAIEAAHGIKGDA